MRRLPRAALAVVILVATLSMLVPASGAAAVPDRLITPLAAGALAPPVPVQGTDGRWHVAYELQLHNWTPSPVVVERLRIRRLRGGRVVARYRSPRAVARLFQTVQFARPRLRDATIDAGQATIVWISLSFARRGAVPRTLVHELRVRGQAPGGGSDRFWMRIARTRVSRRAAVRLGPPLRGTGYVNSNGCCEVSPHTRAVQTFDGVRWLAQRFAIDWVQADDSGRTRDGDPHDPASYFVYGEPVLAVADGRVVSVVDGRRDQSPPMPDTTITRGNAHDFVTGNHVILDIGRGNYPMYAHLQPGSITVRVGDRVRRGQVLALVGNSGNSTEPHLHFHVGSTPRALEADGLPYVYDRFRIAGTVDRDRRAAAGLPDGYTTAVEIDPFRGEPLRRNQLPLIWSVIDFG